LEYDATHDALTGLINRPEFERRLERALNSAQQYGVGTRCVIWTWISSRSSTTRLVTRRATNCSAKSMSLLSGMFRERDTLARIGGDEFGLLMDNCPLDRAQLIAQTVVSAIRDHRLPLGGPALTRSGSASAWCRSRRSRKTPPNCSPRPTSPAISPRKRGRNRVHLYQAGRHRDGARHGEMLGAAGLRDAWNRSGFGCTISPSSPLGGSDRTPGSLRSAAPRGAHKSHQTKTPNWCCHRRSFRLPNVFGLMGAIDRWVIQAAFFASTLTGAGQTGARIAINLSGNSLSDDTLLDFIEVPVRRLRRSRPTACVSRSPKPPPFKTCATRVDLMTALKRRGSQFALDDFGSGLSSFHYLKTLPVDYLKIDGSFVKDMMENNSDCALVAAINQMSHTLGIQTIAEYAHSRAIVERLRELGVDYAQGYFFGQPTPWGQQSS
jgi:EAL domain-containing protein (putative c-di-GMP-specific phosphodiesterase class I)